MTESRGSRVPDPTSGEPAGLGELKGIEPASESRLHQAGVYTWFALADILDSIDALRATADDRLRELAEQVAARASAAGGAPSTPRPTGGQRTESFIVRISLDEDRQPTHTVVAHVRTQAELPLAGWSPGEATRFIAEQAGLQQPSAAPAAPPVAAQTPSSRPVSTALSSPPAGPPTTASTTAPTPPAPVRSSREHVLVMDAGRAFGGRRNVAMTVSTARATGIGEFHYRAVLGSRRFGGTTGTDGWTTHAELTGKAQAPAPLPLTFEAVDLPSGMHRLRLELTVRLVDPRPQAPPLTLEEQGVTGSAAAVGRRF